MQERIAKLAWHSPFTVNFLQIMVLKQYIFDHFHCFNTHTHWPICKEFSWEAFVRVDYIKLRAVGCKGYLKVNLKIKMKKKKNRTRHYIIDVQ